jgi:hypothetical protein
MPTSIWLMGLLTMLVLALVAGAAFAWWRHRVGLLEMKRRLAWSEESRFQLERDAESTDARMQQMARTLQHQQQALLAARDVSVRRATLEAALDKAATGSAATPWADTQPLGPPGDRYAATTPVPLGGAESQR